MEKPSSLEIVFQKYGYFWLPLVFVIVSLLWCSQRKRPCVDAVAPSRYYVTVIQFCSADSGRVSLQA